MIEQLLDGIAIMEPVNGLQEKLDSAKLEDRPLRVKLGFDPTAPDLHLGHAVVLRKLKDFQDAGHQIVIIIGDFTASIGDPTGRNKTRPPLSREEIKFNAETYLSQLGKVINLDRVEIRWNSEWHNKLDLRATINLMSKITAAQIFQREDFKKRFSNGLPIHLHELLYPILQGYDSVVINADIELGGTDQLFNNLMGRHLQNILGKPNQIVITMPLLVGLDGSDKMSKSKGNYIGLTDAPSDMFGKAMSISDEMLEHYINLTTSFSHMQARHMMERIADGENPVNVKRALASNIVELYHGSNAAKAAADHFARAVQSNRVNDEDHVKIPISKLAHEGSIIQNILNISAVLDPKKSRKTLKNLIVEGGVRVNEEKITDPFQKITLSAGTRVWIGKRNWFLLIAG
jgi:tyrosyl-tRNA synthetase